MILLDKDGNLRWDTEFECHNSNNNRVVADRYGYLFVTSSCGLVLFDSASGAKETLSGYCEGTEDEDENEDEDSSLKGGNYYPHRLHYAEPRSGETTGRLIVGYRFLDGKMKPYGR